MSTFGTLWKSDGTMNAVAPTAAMILPSQLYDQIGTPFIRTTGVVKGSSGNWYALLHVGDSYPSQTGFVPAWATSSDGFHWTYHGKLQIDGQTPYTWSSSGALVVQEEKPSVVNHVSPADNRFAAWEDGYSFDGAAKKMVLIYSADAIKWYFYRDAQGEVIDVWPNDPNSTAIFMSVAKTPNGYHMISGDAWPPTRHIHLISEDGLKWTIVEQAAPTFIGENGANLFYDASTNLTHAISSTTSGNIGYHKTFHVTGLGLGFQDTAQARDDVSGDLNDDSSSDIVLQNSSGQISAWFLDGSGNALNFATGAGLKPGSKSIYSGALGDWKVVGVGDLNGDEINDLVFQNGAGQIAAWFLDGSGVAVNFTTRAGLKPPGSAVISSGALGDWKIVGVADLNGDGIPDLVFQNSTGRIAAWFLDGSGAAVNCTTGAGLKPPGSAMIYSGALGGWKVR